MDLFKNQTSQALEGRLSTLRQQLIDAEAAVKSAEEDLESAIAGGTANDKALGVLATARSKVQALQSVIPKCETGLQAAQAREARQRERDRLASVEKRASAAMATIKSQRSKLLEAARGFNAPVQAFDSAVAAMVEVYQGAGLTVFNVPLYKDRTPIASSIKEGRLKGDGLVEALSEEVNGNIASFEAIHEGLGISIARRREELAEEDAAG